MAKAKILLTGSLVSDTVDTTIICKNNNHNEIDIEIFDESKNYGQITLDKSSAKIFLEHLNLCILNLD
jgi:hypothetical protein